MPDITVVIDAKEEAQRLIDLFKKEIYLDRNAQGELTGNAPDCCPLCGQAILKKV